MTGERTWLPVVIAALTALSLGCATSSPTTASGPARPSRLGMDADLLPAGPYFNGKNLRAACPGCRRPQFAGVIGIYSTVKAAEKALRSIPAGLLPAGYPWVVMADDLMLAERRVKGIVLVAALVDDKPKAARLAKAWRKQVGTHLRISKLADEAEAERRQSKLAAADSKGEQRPALVQTEPGEPIDAYDELALEDDALSPKASGSPSAKGKKPGARPATCQVAANALFLFASQQHVYRFGRKYAPARCGERLVFIPWTKTLVDSVVARQPDGTYRLSQVVEVSCDTPVVSEWILARGARVPLPAASKTDRPAQGVKVARGRC
jgi:hypothetical protein